MLASLKSDYSVIYVIEYLKNRQTYGEKSFRSFFLAWCFILFAGCDNSAGGWRPPSSLVIGYAIEAPYSYVDSDGRITGEGPEIARLIAERIGVQSVRWRQVEFGALIHELDHGEIDVIAAGMYITQERSERMLFSVPTLHVTQGILVAAGNPRLLKSYEDAVRKNCRLAVLSNSFEERFLTRLTGVNSSRVLTVPDVPTGVESVVGGIADGFALSEPSLRWLIRSGLAKGCELAHPFEHPQSSPNQGRVAFGFRKKDVFLRDAWNAELIKFLGSDAHDKILESFGLQIDAARPEERSP